MTTTTTLPKPDSVLATADPGETFEQKMARYGSPEFAAAAIRHFHAAKRKALEAKQCEVYQSGPLAEKSS